MLCVFLFSPLPPCPQHTPHPTTTTPPPPFPCLPHLPPPPPAHPTFLHFVVFPLAPLCRPSLPTTPNPPPNTPSGIGLGFSEAAWGWLVLAGDGGRQACAGWLAVCVVGVLTRLTAMFCTRYCPHFLPSLLTPFCVSSILCVPTPTPPCPSVRQPCPTHACVPATFPIPPPPLCTSYYLPCHICCCQTWTAAVRACGPACFWAGKHLAFCLAGCPTPLPSQPPCLPYSLLCMHMGNFHLCPTTHTTHPHPFFFCYMEDGQDHGLACISLGQFVGSNSCGGDGGLSLV